MAKRAKKKKSSPEVVRTARVQAQEFSPVDFVVAHWKQLLQALVIVAAGWWAFSPTLHGDWLWDDDFYITENSLLHDPARLWKTWFEPGSVVNYFPIEATLQWAQWELWGNDTFGYHVTNIVLHLLSSLLVWRLLGKFGLRLAWLGGLLFAIHPTAVESVAWISEFKNTLSLPPFLLAMCAWIDYEERKRRKDYFLALGLFLVAMLCKSTMVAFPVVILLYAWWKRGRVGWNDLKASAPFFMISLVLGLLNVLVLDWFQQNQKTAPDIILIGGMLSRLACSGLALTFYFVKSIWPVGLLPMYPQWRVDPPSLWQFLPWPVMGGVLYGLWRKRQGWGRHALLGLGFFVLNLAPFTGFITNSFMRFTWVMDHFLYIALIGLIGLAVASVQQLYERFSIPIRTCGIGVVAVGMALMADETHWYAGMFINQKTLWTYTLERNPEAWLAHNDLGNALYREGRMWEAVDQFKATLLIKPDYADAHYNLGSTLFQVGRVPEAMEEYGESLRLNPNSAIAHNGMGNALIQTGHASEAKEQYEEALQINPGYADAHNNLGNILFHENRMQESLEQYEQALKINPNYVEALNSEGAVLAKMGRLSEATEQFETVLRIDPNNAAARNNLEQLQRLQSAAPSKQ